MRKLITLLPIASACWFVATIIFGGANHPNYRHVSQFISELGATGVANAQKVNLFGFVPTSILLTAFVLLAIYKSPKQAKQILGLVGIGLYAITLSVAAFYPCDAGCHSDNPSFSQFIHNLSAIIGYLGGIVGIFILASVVRQKGSKTLATVGYALGGLTLTMFFLLSPEFLLVGLAQRVFEISMYTWIILYSFHLQPEIKIGTYAY